jgi:anti-sigma regulatory factor (Ser/Thr protein kinase)
VARFQRELPRKPDASRLARWWLAECVGPDLDGRALDDANLLVSELVTNALVHGRGTIRISATAYASRLRVEVADQGPGFNRTVRERDIHRLGGWGLDLVATLASRWGIHQGRSHVWFELERSGPRQRPAHNPRRVA